MPSGSLHSETGPHVGSSSEGSVVGRVRLLHGQTMLYDDKVRPATGRAGDIAPGLGTSQDRVGTEVMVGPNHDGFVGLCDYLSVRCDLTIFRFCWRLSG